MGLYSNPGTRGRIGKTLLAANLAVVIVLGALQTSTLRAQESQAASKPAESRPPAEPAAKQETLGKEVQKETKEAREGKESGESDAMRNSPMVLWIARHTGLSNNA